MVGPKSALDWIWMPTQQIDQLLSGNNTTWPFLNLSETVFLNLQKSAGEKHFASLVKHDYGTVISAIGILFTLLLICTLWRQVTGNKSTFYMSMMAMAVTDMSYCMVGILYYYWHTTYKITGSPNWVFMWVLIGVRGVRFILSLMSDLITLVLTAERCLAVSKPVLHKNLFGTSKKMTRLIIGIFIFLISLSRIHYSLDRTVQDDGNRMYFFAESYLATLPFVNALTIFSDAIIPIVLSVIVLIMSTYFRVAVAKRRRKKQTENLKQLPTIPMADRPAQKKNLWFRSKVAPSSNTGHHSSTAEAHIEETAENRSGPKSVDHRSMLILTLTLDGLFLINQLAFCVYWAVTHVQESIDFTFMSTESDMTYWIYIHKLVNYADIVVTVVECLTRGMNFPLYMALSRSMRHEFIDWAKRIFEKIRHKMF